MTKLFIVIQTTALDKSRKIHYKDNPDGSITFIELRFHYQQEENSC